MSYVHMTHHQRKFNYFLFSQNYSVCLFVCLYAYALVAPLIVLTFFVVRGISFASKMIEVLMAQKKITGLIWLSTWQGVQWVWCLPMLCIYVSSELVITYLSPHFIFICLEGDTPIFPSGTGWVESIFRLCDWCWLSTSWEWRFIYIDWSTWRPSTQAVCVQY